MAFSTSLQTLVAERDAAFISRVATELNLSLEELTVKYADVAATAFKLPKKRGARAEPKAGSQPCKGMTAKGVPCKFSALPGGECCKRHSRESAEVKEAKPKKEKKEKPVKVVPKHTHDLDGLEHTDCPLCVSQDGPFKLPPTPVAAPAPADSDDESDSEDLIEQLKRQGPPREEEANSDEEDLMWQKAADSDDEDEGLMFQHTVESGGESEFDEE
jgi:hypothetical protein